MCRLASHTVTVSGLRRREAPPNRNRASACASDTGLDPPGQGTARPEPSEWPIDPPGEETQRFGGDVLRIVLAGRSCPVNGE